MRSIRMSSLQWTAALVCTLAGAILLIAPNQLNLQTSSFYTSSASLLGAVFLVVGLLLVFATAFRLPIFATALISVAAGGLLELLAWLFIGKGMWLSSVFLIANGFAIWVVAFLSRRQAPGLCCGSRDLLSLSMGAGSLISGLVMWLRPGLFSSAYFQPISTNYWFYCAGFILSGALLVVLQGIAWLQEPKADTRVFLNLNRLAHLLDAVLVVSFFWAIMLPAGMSGLLLVFSLVFLILAAIPFIGPRLDRNAPSLLSTRLALLLAVTAVIPLVLTVALISSREERMVRQDSLAQQQVLASAIANGIDDYTGLHMDILVSLAKNPDLLQLSRTDQAELLRSAAAAYPDVRAFALFAADGSQLARSDSSDPSISANGFPVYENARQTLQPTHDVLFSPVYNQPIVALGAPVLDSQGHFAGLITAALDSTTINSYIAQHSGTSGSTVYLVDERGIVISSPSGESTSALTDISNLEPFNSLLKTTDRTGTKTYQDAGKEQLVGFARVSGLNWLVVVDRPTESALAGVYSGRNVGFNLLVGSLFLTLLSGVLLAKWAASPLSSLVHAVEALGTGETAPLVNRNKIVEVDQLADAFDTMQDRLERRTLEREQAEIALMQANQALSQVNTELENRVESRTQDLQHELESRVLAEHSLERHLEKQKQLLTLSQEILAEHDLDGLLQKIVGGACALTGAQRGVTGHRFEGGSLQIGASFCSPGQVACLPERSFAIERGGIYMRLMDRVGSLRLSEAELTRQPDWRGLPEGHGDLRGLLGATLTGSDGQPVGMIMVTCKEQDGQAADFSDEDETLLQQLTAIASLALGHIIARKQLEDEQAWLEHRVEERTHDLQVEIEERARIEQMLKQSLVDLQEANMELDRQVEAVTIASQALEEARITVETERQRYQNLFDLAPDGYLVTDIDGRILEANRAAGALLGYRHSKLRENQKKLLVNYVAVKDRKDFRKQLSDIQDIIRLGRVYQTLEYQLEPGFGPPFEAEMTVMGVPGEKYVGDEQGKGKEPQLRWLVRDISERKQLETVARQGARRVAALAEVSRAVMEAGYDHQAILDIVTRSAADLFGDLCVIRTISTDREWLLLVSQYNNDPIKARLEKVELPHATSVHEGLLGKVFSESEAVLLKDLSGDTGLYSNGKEAANALDLSTMMVAPLRSHHQVFGVIMVARRKPALPYLQEDLNLLQTVADRAAQAITNVQLYQDLEHAYQEEQRMRSQLIQAEKHSALSRMVASVAHELNNPIQTVQNCLYLIQTDLPKTDELQEYLGMALSESKRVSNLVSQLRESYRPSQAGEKQIVELNQLLSQTEALLAPHLDHNKVSWRQEPKRGAVLVEVIPDQLKQVFLNICLNAIDAMQPQGGALDVDLDVDKREKIAKVRFHDSGPGIPPDTMKMIFEPFFTTKTTGTGLGLSISYDIVSKHGGDIRVESNPGEGACFTISLPLA